MPNFIEKLFKIVKGDEEDRCRAIRQTGSYRLDDKFKHHEMAVSQWAAVSKECQQKRLKRFLTGMGKASSNTVVSTEGNRTVLKLLQQVVNQVSVRGNAQNALELHLKGDCPSVMQLSFKYIVRR